MKLDSDEVDLLKYTKEPGLRDSILSGDTYSPVVELGKINSKAKGKDMPPPPDGQPSCLPNFHGDDKARAATETLQFLQKHSDAEALLKDKEKVQLMEAIQPTHRGRHRRPSTGCVTQQLVPDTPAASILTISVNIILPAVVHTNDLTKNKPKGGSSNSILVNSCGLGKQATCESTDTRNSGEPAKDSQTSTSQHGVLTALSRGSNLGGGGRASKGGQDCLQWR